MVSTVIRLKLFVPGELHLDVYFHDRFLSCRPVGIGDSLVYQLLMDDISRLLPYPTFRSN